MILGTRLGLRVSVLEDDVVRTLGLLHVSDGYLLGSAEGEVDMFIF